MTRTRSARPRRRAGTVSVLLAVLLALGVGLAQPAAAVPAASTTVTIDCNALAGSGRYSDPIPLGTITTTTVVAGCAPLTSGRYFNVRYFSFTLAQAPSAEAAVLTAYRITSPGESGVHPRLAFGPVTVKHSLDAVYTSSGDTEAFVHSMADLWAGSDWRVGAEKLSSPLGSVQTASFDLVIVP